MVKKLFIGVMVLICFTSNTVFAHQWVKFDNNWYVLNEYTGTFLTDVVFDSGSGVYYIGSDGKMVTGWWKNPGTQKYYYFDNKNEAILGSMLFGLHMIDGYYFYFNNDGTLATSDKLYQLKKVYGDFEADFDGYLYSNGVILRDISIAKSEFYSNAAYYSDPNMNNLVFSTLYTTPNKTNASNLANSQIINQANVSDGTNTTNPYNSVSSVSGGTNYYVDEYGRVRSDYQDKPISNFEIYGPMIGIN